MPYYIYLHNYVLDQGGRYNYIRFQPLYWWYIGQEPTVKQEMHVIICVCMCMCAIYMYIKTQMNNKIILVSNKYFNY